LTRRKVWEGLVVKEFVNLEEAYKLAEKYDKIYEYHKYQNYPNEPNADRRENNVNVTYYEKRCYHCGQEGHVKRFCPFRHTRKIYSNGPGGVGNTKPILPAGQFLNNQHLN